MLLPAVLVSNRRQQCCYCVWLSSRTAGTSLPSAGRTLSGSNHPEPFRVSRVSPGGASGRALGTLPVLTVIEDNRQHQPSQCRRFVSRTTGTRIFPFYFLFPGLFSFLVLFSFPSLFSFPGLFSFPYFSLFLFLIFSYSFFLLFKFSYLFIFSIFS